MGAPDFVRKGQIIQSTIAISGIDSGVDLGAFSFDFFLFPTDLGLVIPGRITFGDQLGDPDNPAETFTGFDMGFVGGATEVGVFNISLLFDLSQQPDAFDLVDFGIFAKSFPGVQDKTMVLGANNFILSDAFGNQIFTENSSASKIVTVVPEPTSLALLLLGFFGVTFKRFANSRNSGTTLIDTFNVA